MEKNSWKSFVTRCKVLLKRVKSKCIDFVVKLNQLCKTMDKVSSNDIQNMEELKQINRQINEIFNNLGIN